MAWGKGKHSGGSDQETRDALASAPVLENCEATGRHSSTVIGPNGVKQCRRCGAPA